MHLELVSLIVEEYDEAIAFFVNKLQFEPVDDSPARTNDGRPKRWVVGRPPGGSTGLLLAQDDPALTPFCWRAPSRELRSRQP